MSNFISLKSVNLFKFAAGIVILLLLNCKVHAHEDAKSFIEMSIIERETVGFPTSWDFGDARDGVLKKISPGFKTGVIKPINDEWSLSLAGEFEILNAKIGGLRYQKPYTALTSNLILNSKAYGVLPIFAGGGLNINSLLTTIKPGYGVQALAGFYLSKDIFIEIEKCFSERFILISTLNQDPSDKRYQFMSQHFDTALILRLGFLF